jgi:hypothetical protein
MRLSVNILESDSSIRNLILNAIISDLNITISKSIPEITNKLKDLIADSLRQEPEYQSLISGKLRAEFGIPNPEDVDKVISALVNTLEVNQQSLSSTISGIKGGFSLFMMKSSDLNGIIYTEIASSMDSSGYSLPWLEWLLLKNNQILVKNYEVKYTNSTRSRSGMALMFHSSQNWRVPPEFAGSQTNNWTTRAVDRVEQKVYDIISQTIEKNI